MRTAFVKALTELAGRDPRIVLITGDLGFGVLDDFAKRYPKQYVNAGVAEQNMTGMAAGMAMAGKVVFTYSIGNFPTLRCLEQVRNDVCYHKANVKIVCVGGGMAYGALGISHHATEDLAILRALPNMTVVAPADPVEASAATAAVAAHDGPCYLRLGKAGEPVVHTGAIDFKIGRGIRVKPGRGIVIFSTGGMLAEVMKAASQLGDCGVVSMHTVKPLDEAMVLECARSAKLVVTAEEHSVVGGLGGAVAEVVADAGVGTRLLRIGFPSIFTSEVGSQEYLRGVYGLSAERIVAAVQRSVTASR